MKATSNKLDIIAKKLLDKDVLAKEPVSHLQNFLFLRRLVKKHAGETLKIRELEKLADMLKGDYGVGREKQGRMRNKDLAKLANQLAARKFLDPDTKLDQLGLYRLVKKNFGQKLDLAKLQKLSSILRHDHEIELNGKKKKPKIQTWNEYLKAPD